MTVEIERYHDFCMGHRVFGHESKCAHVHGHNYRVHITATAPKLDHLGRVLDFSELKRVCCEWVETNIDHKFMVFEQDAELKEFLISTDPDGTYVVDFNPTAENIAEYLFCKFNDELVDFGTKVRVTKIRLEETRKCSATYTWEG